MADIFDRLMATSPEPIAPTGGDVFDRVLGGGAAIAPERPQAAPGELIRPSPAPIPAERDIFARLAEEGRLMTLPGEAPLPVRKQPRTMGERPAVLEPAPPTASRLGRKPGLGEDPLTAEDISRELMGLSTGPGLGIGGLADIGVGVLSDTAQFVAQAPIGLEAMVRVGFQGADETTEVIKKRQEMVQNLMGYEPRTEAGKSGMAAIHRFFALFAEAGEFWGERTPGGPVAQASVGTFFEALPILAPVAKKMAGKKGKALTPEETRVLAEAEKALGEVGKTLEKKVDFKNLEGDLLREPPKDIFDKAVEKSTAPVEARAVEPVRPAEAITPSEAPRPTDIVRSEEALRPTERPKIELTEDAGKAWTVFEKSEKESQAMSKTKAGDVYKALKRGIVDVGGNVKAELRKQGPLGKEAVMHQELIAGAGSKAMADLNAASREIYQGLNKTEQRWLNATINSRRIVAIDTFKAPKVPEGLRQLGFPERPSPIKHPGGLTAKEHQALLNEIPVELRENLTARADRYFAETRSQLDQLRQEGLISERDYNNLVAVGDYSPRRVLKYVDPEVSRPSVGGKITVPDSGIKALKEGTIDKMEMNSPLLLSEVIVRTQTRIFKNRANKALYELATTTPKNPIARPAKVVRTTKEGQPVYEKAPAGHEKVSVMVEGQPREMIMPTELAREWVKSDPQVSPGLAAWAGWLSGSKVLKAMATGLNPEFALANLPRDIGRALLVTTEFSPHLVKAVPQIGLDMVKVFPDVLLRKGRFKDYVREGGGMETLTQQGRLTSKTKGAIGKIQDVMGYLGETSEMLTRIAIRERAIKNGKTPTEATHIARSQLDFSQGGSFIKAADTAIPYLNAAIQGTRGYFTAAKKNKKVFAYKVGQIGTLSAGLYLANKFMNPEAWDQIPARDKVGHFILTTPFSYHDKDGNKKWMYFRIPKDQGQRVVSTISENLMAKYMGDEVDDVQVRQAIADFAPIVPTGAVPPVFSAMLGYMSNKDFFRNEDIWKGAEVEPSQEFTRFTHPAFVAAGEAAGVSPERLKHALSQYFTTGNIYTSMVGYGWKELLAELPEEQREQVSQELLLKKPFIRRLVRSTRPGVQFKKELKEAKIQANTEKLVLSRDFDAISQDFYDGQAGREAVTDFIRNAPPEERSRLNKRHIRRGRIQNLPNRQWWMELGGASPETKALMYWNRWRVSTPEQRKELEEQLRRVPGIQGKRFHAKLGQLKRTKFEEE
ncbi:MAG: hypothetical protein KAR40_09710 [Candidatus Sabulitectum sp.]|nr:hypothetical protein [Candidatus Sabulitectum sp.]